MKYNFSPAILLAAMVMIIACKYNKQGDPAAHYDHESTADDSARIPNHVEENKAYDTTNRLPAPGKIDSTPLSGTLNENFVNTAASTGMMEVALGQIAQTQAASARVQAFATMMVADHRKINDELKAIAGAKNHVLPTAMSTDWQKKFTAMRKRQGKDFDTEYISTMVSSHQKALRLFEKTDGTVSDTTVKAFARRHLHTLRMHLDSARAINRDF